VRVITTASDSSTGEKRVDDFRVPTLLGAQPKSQFFLKAADVQRKIANFTCVQR
jgi:hypothetical protein